MALFQASCGKVKEILNWSPRSFPYKHVACMHVSMTKYVQSIQP